MAFEVSTEKKKANHLWKKKLSKNYLLFKANPIHGSFLTHFSLMFHFYTTYKR